MKFSYLAYGISINSQIELSMLFKCDKIEGDRPIFIRYGRVPKRLINEPNVRNEFTQLNSSELLFFIPEVGHFYIFDGNTIVVEPLSKLPKEVELYICTVALAAVLSQRNIIPFHVSGVFTKNDEVVLFAAPSCTGKSTTVTMLQKKGYKIFVDDTCTIEIINGIAYARASYPMARLWQNTIDKQGYYDDKSKTKIFNKTDKFGFFFHEEFCSDRVRIDSIVFLEKFGVNITLEKLNPMSVFQYLCCNIYGEVWFSGVNKETLLFNQLTKVSDAVKGFKAIRPLEKESFEDFAAEIDKCILCNV